MTRLVEVVVIFLSLDVISSVRRHGAEIEASSATQGQAEFGSTISSRFEMSHALWRQDLDSRVIEHLNHIPLPGEVLSHFTNTKDLYAGSFGEAWAATDKETGKRVVLKMFYTTVGESRKHITWAAAGSDPNLKSQLEDAASECAVAREMQKYATEDPTGASRLMQCYEDHVTKGTSLTGHTVTSTQELFQVLEDCGGHPLNKWLEKQATSGNAEKHAESHMYLALQLGKQMMEGLNYLTSHTDKWCHHDLKPANVVVKVLPDGKEILKLIDFGSVTKISYINARKPIVSTIAYAPSEWFPVARGFDASHPASFDLYQAALILDEILTGDLFFEKVAARAEPITNAHVDNCVRLNGGIPGYSKELAQACVQQLSIDNIKGANGAEHEITGRYGESSTTISTVYELRTKQYYDYRGVLREDTIKVPKSKVVRKTWEEAALDYVDNAEALLVGSVPREFSNAAIKYADRARRKNWWPMFMRMIAWKSANRPTPQEVLDSPFMASITSIPDPDFNAADAQASSNPSDKKHQSRFGLTRVDTQRFHIAGDRTRGSVVAFDGPAETSNPVVPCPGNKPGSVHLCIQTGPHTYRQIN